jgi:hypothetical protein
MEELKPSDRSSGHLLEASSERRPDVQERRLAKQGAISGFTAERTDRRLIVAFSKSNA